MKLSQQWLGELVALGDVTAEEIHRLLTFHVAEMEDVTPVGQALEGVVTARVRSMRPHPKADRLRLVTVETHAEGTAQEVVCGAPNVAEGQIVAFAPVGARLPDGKGGVFELVAKPIRGVKSAGMILAADEMGCGDDHAGIVVLPAETAVGVAVADVLPVQDTIHELSNVSITHRPDLWGHVGFARELAALLSLDAPQPALADLGAWSEGLDEEGFPVEVADPEGCSRYLAFEIEGLTNGPSPLAWRVRLERLGVRSIDRIVDLTNLVLLEMGQPLHAFDRRALRGDRIEVRRARAGEPFVGLDDITYTLDTEDLVIADAEGPVALAGVMGGQASAVRADTQAIVLEAARFDPVRVRRSAARHGLRTESSSRFEKGLDPELAEAGARRFLALAKEVMPDARLVRLPRDARSRPPASRVVDLPLALVRRRLGIRVPDAVVRSKLTRLGFRVEETGASLRVRVPSWRAGSDIVEPMDVVEEVGRMVGYDKIMPLAPTAPMRVRKPDARRRLERRALTFLSLDRGYAEIKSYAFLDEDDLRALDLDAGDHLTLRRREGDGAAGGRLQVLTQASVAKLLRAAARNRVVAPQGALMESTRLLPPGADGALPHEARVLGGVTWDTTDEDAQPGRVVLHLIEDLRRLFVRLGLPPLRVRPGAPAALRPELPEPTWLHPGRAGTLLCGEVVVGTAGEIVPRVLRAFDCQGRVACFEMDLDGLLDAQERGGGAGYEPPLRYPVVPFDVAAYVPRRTLVADVAALIEAAAPGHVRDVQCFDVYQGKGVPADMKSVAFRLVLFDREATLSGKAADGLRALVRTALTDAGFTLRAE